MREQNIESLQNMYENLFANNINPEEIPVILQYNKRDLPNILSFDELNGDLNKNRRYEHTEATAIDGIGVENTFQHITKLVLKGITERHKVTVSHPEELRDTVVEEKEAPVEPSDELRETVVMQEPHGAEIIDKLTSEAIFPSASSEEPEAPSPESIMYGPTAEETSHYEPTTEAQPGQEEHFQAFLEEKLSHLEEVLMKDINESLRKHKEQIEKKMNGIADNSSAFVDLKNEVSKLQNEIRDLKKEQKDIYILLREIQHAFENIKEKKSWFRLS
jgi:hypothetical protein